MTTSDCFLDTNGCLVCPEIPATTGYPSRIVNDPQLGWNAGANSIGRVDGDAHVVFSIDQMPAGIMVGFRTDTALNSEPSLIDHALYVYGVGGQAFVEIRERGALVGAARQYTLGNPLEIRRVGAEVSYWVNGARVASTRARSMAQLLVNACLYAAGDVIP